MKTNDNFYFKAEWQKKFSCLSMDTLCLIQALSTRTEQRRGCIYIYINLRSTVYIFQLGLSHSIADYTPPQVGLQFYYVAVIN